MATLSVRDTIRVGQWEVRICETLSVTTMRLTRRTVSGGALTHQSGNRKSIWLRGSLGTGYPDERGATLGISCTLAQAGVELVGARSKSDQHPSLRLVPELLAPAFSHHTKSLILGRH